MALSRSRVSGHRYHSVMRPEKAIEHLKTLRDEAKTPDVQADSQTSKTWRQNVRAVFSRSLGEEHHLVKQFDKVRYSVGVWSESTPKSAWVNAYRGGISKVCAYIDSAIYELELSTDTTDVPFDDASYDPELLSHVRKTIDVEDWEKLAAQVVIFLEDRVRKWSESAAGLVGKGLYASALADDAELRLGQVKGEWEGWRMLCMGFAQAIGNVARHRLQDRPDSKRYAIGVLGAGSLLLTQLRYEHDELIVDRNV